MDTQHTTEFNVNGLVIFDLNDLPEVTVDSDTISAGDTTIPRKGTNLTYEDLRKKSQELYAIALKVREDATSPELGRMIALVESTTNHTSEEAREIALHMLQNGATLDN